MRTYRSQEGPFQERPYFEQAEIEAMCQEELGRCNLFPSSPEPIRIERFIEKRFRVTPAYEELPNGVLGFTRFSTDGVQAIVVSRSLVEEESRTSERRVNSTLAHEAGHGLLHAHLFALGSQPERLFAEDFDPRRPRIMCRDEPSGASPKGRYDGRWWEFQANQAIGALLLPKPLAETSLDGTLLVSGGTLGLRRLNPQDRGRAVEVLATTFNVNRAVARIRLEQLFPARDSAQLSL